MLVWNSTETMSPPESRNKTKTKHSSIAEKTPKITKKRKHGEDTTAIRSLCSSESACEEFRASPGQPVYKEEASAMVVFNRQLASEAIDNLLGMPAREKGVENRNSSPKLLSTSRAPLTEIQNAVSKASQRSDREQKHGDRWLKCLPTKSMNNLCDYRWLSLNESVQEPSVVEKQRERLQRSNVAERKEMIDLNVVPPEQLLESSIDGWKDTTSTTNFILKQPCPSMNRTMVESRWREDHLQDNKQLMEGPTESVESPRAKAAAMILLQMSKSSWDHRGFTSDQESPSKMEGTKGRSKNGRLKETQGTSKNGKIRKPGNGTKSTVSHLHEYLNTNTDRCQRSDWILADETEPKRSVSDFQVLSCPSLAPKKRRKPANTKPKVCAAKQGNGNPVCERPERLKDTHKRGVVSKNSVEEQGI